MTVFLLGGPSSRVSLSSGSGVTSAGRGDGDGRNDDSSSVGSGIYYLMTLLTNKLGDT